MLFISLIMNVRSQSCIFTLFFFVVSGDNNNKVKNVRQPCVRVSVCVVITSVTAQTDPLCVMTFVNYETVLTLPSTRQPKQYFIYLITLEKLICLN